MPSVMSFPTRIVHGRGAIRELPAELKRAGATRELPAELKRAGARRVLLVTDKGILQAGLLRFVTPLLEQAGVPFTVFSEFDPNPTDADALKGIEAYRAGGADAIVAGGGGASLDMGKGIRLLAHHHPPAGRARSRTRARRSPAPTPRRAATSTSPTSSRPSWPFPPPRARAAKWVARRC